jgi:helicase SWR1
MNRRTTAEDLGSGMYYRIANILMQLRKVCNHPDLFEVRPIVTSFAMSRSAVSGFEVKELLIRRRLHFQNDELSLSSLPGLRFVDTLNTSVFAHVDSNRAEDLTSLVTPLGSPVIKDTRTISGFKAYRTYEARSRTLIRRMDMDRMNRRRCSVSPSILSAEAIICIRSMVRPLVPLSEMDQRLHYLSTSAIAHSMVLSHPERAVQMDKVIDRFACVTPPAIAVDLPRLALAGSEGALHSLNEQYPNLLQLLHRPSIKLQIAFPDSSLLQYDCGKLQELYRLLRERKAGGHRVLLFTQMTKVLDIVESFLNLHGYLYLRLDGSTKIEDRQYITERFNSDSRIFCFISSSRSGGVGIKYVLLI